MIEVKLLMGDSHGKVVTVSRFVQAIEMPKMAQAVKFVGWATEPIYSYMATEQYLIHQLPGGRLIGLPTGYTLARWLDGVIDSI